MVDGGGYRNVKVTNSVDVEGRVSLNYKGFYAAVGGYTGKLGNDTEGAVDADHTATREDALVGYKNKMFNVGAEYFHAKNYKTVTTVADDKADGYSAVRQRQLQQDVERVRPLRLGQADQASTQRPT